MAARKLDILTAMTGRVVLIPTNVARSCTIAGLLNNARIRMVASVANVEGLGLLSMLPKLLARAPTEMLPKEIHLRPQAPDGMLACLGHGSVIAIMIQIVLLKSPEQSRMTLLTMAKAYVMNLQMGRAPNTQVATTAALTQFTIRQMTVRDLVRKSSSV